MNGMRKRSELVEPIWFEWAALAGLLAFAGWLLGARGVWALLLHSDPTGITLVIIIVFVCASIWCGARARELSKQELLAQSGGRSPSSWVHDYLEMVNAQPAQQQTALDLLVEKTHGAHGVAWWVNGIQLKLGLLGKVIGFSILALQIGNMQNFDATQSQELLRSLTTGLGVALLTTMVGLVGNILLGLQLTRLDRFADSLVDRAQRLGLAQMNQNQAQNAVFSMPNRVISPVEHAGAAPNNIASQNASGAAQ